MSKDRDFTLLRPWLADGRRHPREPDQDDCVIVLPTVRVEAYGVGFSSGDDREQQGDAERNFIDRDGGYRRTPPRADVKRGPLAKDLRRAERCLRFLRRAHERNLAGLPLDISTVDVAYLEKVCTLVFKAMQEYGSGLARDKKAPGG